MTYETIYTFNEEFPEKWTEVNFDYSKGYRYVRFSSSQCQVAEFEVYGVKVLNKTITPDSQLCPLKIVLNDFTYSVDNVVEYRSDKTPVITGFSE